MPLVLKPWMKDLTFCQQSTIIQSCRKPDFINDYKINDAIKWIRSVSQEDGRDSRFMKGGQLAPGHELAESLKMCSLDFAIHFVHALEVIAYMHPHPWIANRAEKAYHEIVSNYHFRPETKKQMNERLRGK